MRKDQTSVTAMGIAVNRAFESEKPADERICYDPYARQFLPGWFYGLVKLFLVSGYAERSGPGVQSFLAARERYIDDCLLESLKNGFAQLVILGAGYDSRPYRFAELLKSVHTYEIDHPATQKAKLKSLQKVFDHVPENVTFVPIDFNHQSLSQRLAESGYDPKLITLFIWQGVTYYLEPGAVDQTLAFIAGQSAPGSKIIFDYIDLSVLENSSGHGEVKRMQRYRGITGEALRFGISARKIENFLLQRGFENVCNIRSSELKPLYFKDKNESRKVVDGYGIVSAVVASYG
jgi:methyltransferase (TIGR00027 family)